MGLFSFRSKGDSSPQKESVAPASSPQPVPVQNTPVEQQDPFTDAVNQPPVTPTIPAIPEPVAQEVPATSPQPVPAMPEPVAPTIPDPSTPAMPEPSAQPDMLGSTAEPVIPAMSAPSPDIAAQISDTSTEKQVEEVEEAVDGFQVPDLAPVDNMPDMPLVDEEPTEEEVSTSLVSAEPEEEPEDEEDVSEDISPVESQVTLQKNGVVGMNSNLQRADDHLARVLDDENIMTAKVAVWHDILSSVQENLIAIDMRLFDEGDN